MNSPQHPCDSIQQEISAVLDDGRKLPADIALHIACCTDCAEFLNFCTDEAQTLLAGPLPPAGIGLRDKILALPKSPTLAKPEPSCQSGDKTWRASRHLSAVAAAVVIGLCGYWMIDIRPAGSTARNDHGERFPTGKAAAMQELAALDADFKQGLSELRGPLQSMQGILNR